MTEQAGIDALCRAAGVALFYADSEGRTHFASDVGKRSALKSLGLRIESSTDIDESLARFDQEIKCGHSRWHVVDANEPTVIRIGNAQGSVAWTLRTEAGDVYEGRETGHVSLPSLPAGYHQLTITTSNDTSGVIILAAPARCYLPPALESGSRGWGITAQVYSLRGAHDFGIGTYADVAKLAAAVGERGGAFLGLSPVHALFGADPSKYSPYSPSSRLFLQTNLIAPHAVAGFDVSDMPERVSEPADHLIDYQKVLPRQRAALEAIWTRTRAIAERSIGQFRREGGARLEEHATFEALSDHFRAQGKQWAGEWPEAFHDPRSDAVAAFRRDYPDEIAFHVWLQWIADTQLANAAAVSREKGMTVGLYRDLAVGADRGGSEFWSESEAFLSGLSVGAPPDPLGPQGQNWGLPPLNPLTLADTGFAAFRALVAANMRHAGAIRIDHAFQLQRLFVIPSGCAATDGVYLNYPLDALLGVLKIESHRAKCLVIGEDLGTAPAGFSDAIMDAGMLSYRLLPFEREHEGVFKEPAAYPTRALAAVSTHDLPTFEGWWRGLDIDVRECLGVFDGSRSADERNGRANDRQRLSDALNAEGLDATPRLKPSPDIAALRYLARTPCVLAATQIEDVLREQQQANCLGLIAAIQTGAAVRVFRSRTSRSILVWTVLLQRLRPKVVALLSRSKIRRVQHTACSCMRNSRSTMPRRWCLTSLRSASVTSMFRRSRCLHRARRTVTMSLIPRGSILNSAATMPFGVLAMRYMRMDFGCSSISSPTMSALVARAILGGWTSSNGVADRGMRASSTSIGTGLVRTAS